RARVRRQERAERGGDLFTHPLTAPRRTLIGLAGLAFLMGVAAFVVMLNGEHNVHRGAYAGLFLVTGWGFVGVGLWVWKQRSAGNIGPLMVAVGLSGLLKGLAFSNDSVVFAIASVGEVLIYAVLIQLLLSFPSGRLETRLDRLLVTIAYVNTTVVPLGVIMFTDSKAGCTRCPSNPLLIEHSEAAKVLEAAQLDISIALLGAVVAVLYRRWRSGTPGRARVFAPIVAVGGLTFLLVVAAERCATRSRTRSETRPWSSPIGYRTRTPTWTPTVRRFGSIPRRRARSPPSSSTRANESLRSCTVRASRRNANWCRQLAPPPG